MENAIKVAVAADACESMVELIAQQAQLKTRQRQQQKIGGIGKR